MDTPTGTGDNLTALLEQIRERHAIITESCGKVDLVIGRYKRSSNDIPVLLAAVEAGLKRHRPVIRKQGHPAMCEWDNRRWPCPEVTDITDALKGEKRDA